MPIGIFYNFLVYTCLCQHIFILLIDIIGYPGLKNVTPVCIIAKKILMFKSPAWIFQYHCLF